MNVETPVFIVGMERSGCEVLHRLLSRHPEVAWLSTPLAERYPHRAEVHRRLLRVVELPLIGNVFRARFGPGEAYAFWEHGFHGFTDPCRDLVRGDVTLKAKRELPRAVASVLTARRHRFVAKISGWPRIGFLDEVFPDARFVHVHRDLHAVANSVLDGDEWWGWRGPENWRWGALTEEQIAEWEECDRSFVALAGLEIRILGEAMRKARAQVEAARVRDVRYEDLCDDPLAVLRDLVEFCRIEWLDSYAAAARAEPLRSSNHQWRNELTPQQQQILERFVAPLREPDVPPVREPDVPPVRHEGVREPRATELAVTV